MRNICPPIFGNLPEMLMAELHPSTDSQTSMQPRSRRDFSFFFCPLLGPKPQNENQQQLSMGPPQTTLSFTTDLVWHSRRNQIFRRNAQSSQSPCPESRNLSLGRRFSPAGSLKYPLQKKVAHKLDKENSELQ